MNLRTLVILIWVHIVIIASDQIASDQRIIGYVYDYDLIRDGVENIPYAKLTDIILYDSNIVLLKPGYNATLLDRFVGLAHKNDVKVSVYLKYHFSEPDSEPDSELDSEPDSELDSEFDSELDSEPDSELEKSAREAATNTLTELVNTHNIDGFHLLDNSNRAEFIRLVSTSFGKKVISSFRSYSDISNTIKSFEELNGFDFVVFESQTIRSFRTSVNKTDLVQQLTKEFAEPLAKAKFSLDKLVLAIPGGTPDSVEGISKYIGCNRLGGVEIYLGIQKDRLETLQSLRKSIFGTCQCGGECLKPVDNSTISQPCGDECLKAVDNVSNVNNTAQLNVNNTAQLNVNNTAQLKDINSQIKKAISQLNSTSSQLEGIINGPQT